MATAKPKPFSIKNLFNKRTPARNTANNNNTSATDDVSPDYPKELDDHLDAVLNALRKMDNGASTNVLDAILANEPSVPDATILKGNKIHDEIKKILDAENSPNTSNYLSSKTAGSDFDKIVAWILSWEGKRANDKNDAGGVTNMGVTQDTYDRWRDSRKQPRGHVYNMSETEAKDVYYNMFWIGCGCDKLTDRRLAFVHMNASVGSGYDSVYHANMPTYWISRTHDPYAYIAMQRKYYHEIMDRQTAKRNQAIAMKSVDSTGQPVYWDGPNKGQYIKDFATFTGWFNRLDSLTKEILQA
jgi:hypothetical protein